MRRLPPTFVAVVFRGGSVGEAALLGALSARPPLPGASASALACLPRNMAGLLSSQRNKLFYGIPLLVRRGAGRRGGRNKASHGVTDPPPLSPPVEEGNSICNAEAELNSPARNMGAQGRRSKSNSRHAFTTSSTGCRGYPGHLLKGCRPSGRQTNTNRAGPAAFRAWPPG